MSTQWPAHIERDARLPERLLPELRRILAERLVLPASLDDDRQRNTDLIVLRAPDDIRIACRVRRFEYLARYGHQITIRADRPSGADTELKKILDGWGRYFIYGFADADETRLVRWLLGDLDVFRRWWAHWVERFPDSRPGEVGENRDGSSNFRAFDPALIRVPVTTLRADEFIVAAEGYERYRPVVIPGRPDQQIVEFDLKARPTQPRMF